jgi:hypothetical protein
MRKMILATILPLALALLIGADKSPKPEPGRLIFSHKLHVVENSLECAQCHSSAVASTSGGERLIPGMGKCAECHEVAGDETCVMCHSDPKKVVKAPHAKKEYSAFSHKLHTAKLECKECHTREAGENDAAQAYPAMKDCYDCHSKKNIRPECNRCHAVIPSSPESHKVGWKSEHGLEARFDAADCAMCHQAPDAKVECNQCHVGLAFGSPHPQRFSHSKAFIRGGGMVECQTCHETESFCAPCHVRQNVIPLNHSRANWARGSEGGGFHARKAEADVESCVICHTALQRQPSCSNPNGGCH